MKRVVVIVGAAGKRAYDARATDASRQQLMRQYEAALDEAEDLLKRQLSAAKDPADRERIKARARELIAEAKRLERQASSTRDAREGELKRGDWIKENRSGAEREQVLSVNGTSIETYRGNRYHVTKVVKDAHDYGDMREVSKSEFRRRVASGEWKKLTEISTSGLVGIQENGRNTQVRVR